MNFIVSNYDTALAFARVRMTIMVRVYFNVDEGRRSFDRTDESPSESYSLQSQITKAMRTNGTISLLFTGATVTGSMEKPSQFSNGDSRKWSTVDAFQGNVEEGGRL